MKKNLPNNYHPLQLLNINQVSSLVNLSKTSIWQMVKEKKFPAPLKIGQRARAWKAADIDKWINSLKSNN